MAHRTRASALWQDRTLAFTTFDAEGRAEAVAPGTVPGAPERIARAWGVLAGERALVHPFAKRRGELAVEPLTVTVQSPYRIAPREDHFTSCSPWQILAYTEQVRTKHALLAQLFSPEALPDHASPVPVDAFTDAPPDAQWGYRTKIEYSFTECDGTLHLAFFARGRRRKVPLQAGCALAGDASNTAALFVRDALRAANIPAQALKLLTLREAKHTPAVLATLYVTDRSIAATLPPLQPPLVGLRVVYSDPQSPAPVETEVLRAEGAIEIEEQVANLRLRYGPTAFFQNNVPVFEKALVAMGERATALRPTNIVELYAGIGTIGLALAPHAKTVVGVELNAEAVACANANAALNGITTYHAEAHEAERTALETLVGADLVVLDPPRAGLHPKAIQLLHATNARHIFYLSCNPVTQARDYALLAERYHATSLEGFDFYPQTPHLESLLLLERRKNA